MKRNGWIFIVMLTVLAVGIQGCGAKEEAAPEPDAAAQAAAEQAAREAAEREAAEAAAREAAEREAAEAAAREAAEREARRRHTVVEGDCLWCIAEDRWADGYRWSAIYDLNTGQIQDPDLIYPGQVLMMPEE